MLLWHLRLLVVVSAVIRGHLRREDTWCDAVDANFDAVFRDLGREHLVQVDCCALTGVVRKVVLRDPDVA